MLFDLKGTDLKLLFNHDNDHGCNSESTIRSYASKSTTVEEKNSFHRKALKKDLNFSLAREPRNGCVSLWLSCDLTLINKF